MASTGSLIDNFDDSSFDGAKWTRSDINHVQEIFGEIQMSSLAAGSYYVLDSFDTALDLTGSYAIIQVLDAGNQSITSWETYPVQVAKDSSNYLEYRIIGNSLQAWKKVATVSTQVGSSITYNSSEHKWLRIREGSGTIFWDFSRDGYTWTNQASVANPFVVTAVFVEISVGTWQAEGSTTTMRIDNFNVIQTAGAEMSNYRHVEVGNGMSRNEGAT